MLAVTSPIAHESDRHADRRLSYRLTSGATFCSCSARNDLVAAGQDAPVRSDSRCHTPHDTHHPAFLAATASVANFYMVCQRELYPRTWMERLRYLPFLMSIGIGLAVNYAGDAGVDVVQSKEA